MILKQGSWLYHLNYGVIFSTFLSPPVHIAQIILLTHVPIYVIHNLDPPREVLAAMKKFGFKGFRPGQQEAIMRILCGMKLIDFSFVSRSF